MKIKYYKHDNDAFSFRVDKVSAKPPINVVLDYKNTNLKLFVLWGDNDFTYTCEWGPQMLVAKNWFHWKINNKLFAMTSSKK